MSVNDHNAQFRPAGRGRGTKSKEPLKLVSNGRCGPAQLNSGHAPGQIVDHGYRVAKSSKKVTNFPTRPAMEIYRPPPVLRRDLPATKSSEDLRTKPFIAAGLKQQTMRSNTFVDTKRNSTEHLQKFPAAFGLSNSAYYQQGKMHYKSRTFSNNKSTENLRSTQQRYRNPLVVSEYDETSNSRGRSVTPPARVNGGDLRDGEQTASSFSTQAAVKRAASFTKEPPKKKSFGSKEVLDANGLFEALGLAGDDLISKWIAEKYERSEAANPVGQVLVQMAIEHGKPVKTVAKLCSLLIESPSGEQFHKGILDSCLQYYDCRVKLKENHFNFWIAFINCISELYVNFGLTYEGELVEILLQLYTYLLEPAVIEQIRIEELECLISSLLSVGYNLERQCPDKLTEFQNKLRDAFMLATEPWVRKMLLLMIELSASGWKLPVEANEYYFHTQSTATTAYG